MTKESIREVLSDYKNAEELLHILNSMDFSNVTFSHCEQDEDELDIIWVFNTDRGQQLSIDLEDEEPREYSIWQRNLNHEDWLFVTDYNFWRENSTCDKCGKLITYDCEYIKNGGHCNECNSNK